MTFLLSRSRRRQTARFSSSLARTIVIMLCAWGLPVQAQDPISGPSDHSAPLEQDLKPYQSRINALLDRIESETSERLRRVATTGEMLQIDYDQTRDKPIVSIQNGTLNVFIDDCSGKETFNNWQALAYPLRVDVSVEADTTNPFVNLKWVLIANAVQSEADDGSLTCASRAPLPDQSLYKIILASVSEGQNQWSTKKNFANLDDYEKSNRPQRRNTSVPDSAILCRDATRLCYSNSGGLDLVGHLTFQGVRDIESGAEVSGDVYLETRRTEKETSERFPRLDFEVIQAPSPIIPEYLKKHNQHVNIIAAKDNAAGRFTASDIEAMRDVGLDLGELGVRGSHISILQPNRPPITRTSEEALSLQPEDHGVSRLGLVASAGFAHGDRATIMVGGKNVSPNKRGLNIVTMDERGKVIATTHFDTHNSSFRNYGYFRVN